MPTQDWLDRAAATLTHTADSSVVLGLFATVDAAGRIESHEAIGVAAASLEDQAVLETLRSRAIRLQNVNLGTWKPGDACAMAARLADLMPDWRTGALGRIWPTPHPAEVVVAAAGAADAPTLLAFIGCPRNPEVPVAVLPVVMPLLAEAAVKCLLWATDDSRSRLTVKEQEVLAQLAQGRSVRQIAETLGRSPHTVHDHVKALHRKLDASSRGELIAKALGHLPPARAHCPGDPAVESRPTQPL